MAQIGVCILPGNRICVRGWFVRLIRGLFRIVGLALLVSMLWLESSGLRNLYRSEVSVGATNLDVARQFRQLTRLGAFIPDLQSVTTGRESADRDTSILATGIEIWTF